MQREPTSDATAPRFTRAGFMLGFRTALPLLPGVGLFGMAFGAAAAQKGLALWEAVLMSAIVYGGVLQSVTLEVWSQPMTLGAIAAMAFVTAVVNLRYLLMGASLRRWAGGLPAWKTYSSLFLLTDSAWIIGMRHRAAGGADFGTFIGSAFSFWTTWICVTPIGFLVGALLSNPQRFGLDLILPIYFATILVPIWRGYRRAIPWLVAGGVAVAMQHFAGGWWFLIAGPLAGCIVGGFVKDE